MKKVPYDKSLEHLNPELAKQWHPTKNGELTPADVKEQSTAKVWWICNKGHQWEAQVRSRSRYGTNCPYCAGKKVSIGENDFQSLYPDIAKEWNYKKNKNLNPSMFTGGSGKIVWWICNQGHEWKTSINHRRQGTNCPYCAGKKVAVGYNDFQTRFPDIAKEWHPIKNDTQKASDFTWCSSKKVWWLCGKGHEWKTSISNRAGGKGCPYCSGKKAIEGETDLVFLYPELASEWHPSKNGELVPTKFKAGSEKKVWWVCKNGHEWQATINNRSKGCNCPYCRGHKVIPNEKSLEIQHPDVAKEWNYKRNGSLHPSMFLSKSGIKVWWICSEGHEWQNRIADRVNGRKCPYCTGKRVIVGLNDITITHPNISKEWDYSKNGTVPEQYSYGSGKKVWWICSEGHAWQAKISNRTLSNNGCPYCSGLKAIKGVNDLKTLYPMIADEWHPEKNRKFVPEEFLPYSAKKVWWRCSEGHEWFTSIRNRTNGSGCPKCNRK